MVGVYFIWTINTIYRVHKVYINTNINQWQWIMSTILKCSGVCSKINIVGGKKVYLHESGPFKYYNFFRWSISSFTYNIHLYLSYTPAIPCPVLASLSQEMLKRNVLLVLIWSSFFIIKKWLRIEDKPAMWVISFCVLYVLSINAFYNYIFPRHPKKVKIFDKSDLSKILMLLVCSQSMIWFTVLKFIFTNSQQIYI